MVGQTRNVRYKWESRPRKRGRSASSSSSSSDGESSESESGTASTVTTTTTTEVSSRATEIPNELEAKNATISIPTHSCKAEISGASGYHVIDIGEIIAQALRKADKHKAGVSDLESALDERELHFFRKLEPSKRAEYNLAHEALLRTDPDATPMRFKLLNLDLHVNVKTVLMRKLKTLMQMEDHPSGEYHKLQNWMNRLCRIPFGKIVPMPVTKDSTRDAIVRFIDDTRATLNTQVYGHGEAKDQIIRIVAQWISNPSSKGNVIGIHGSPGVGKTTLIKEGVCKALGLPFAFIPLGGAGDASYLDGHSYTYEGSCPGRIVDMVSMMSCMNPVLYFDELDKVSTSFRGKEIVNVLIHLTDPSQNEAFQDKYFSEVPIDLSKCLVIFTYNNPDNIDPILRDRMITIHTKDYSLNDKKQIVQEHLLESIVKDFSLSKENVLIDNEVIGYIVERIDKEAGVRNLKRALESIVSNINLEILTNNEDVRFPLQIDRNLVDKYVPIGTYNARDNSSISHLYT
jgi:ATP-dependent Lon protease